MGLVVGYFIFQLVTRGEELFDFGSLGHGTEISFEQNSTLGKMINSPWFPDQELPVGHSEIAKLIYNALLQDGDNAVPLDGQSLALLGTRKPLQIGLFTKNGLTRYDFRKDTWAYQSAFGSPAKQTAPDAQLIHLWESYVLTSDGESN